MDYHIICAAAAIIYHLHCCSSGVAVFPALHRQMHSVVINICCFNIVVKYFHLLYTTKALLVHSWSFPCIFIAQTAASSAKDITLWIAYSSTMTRPN